MNKLNVGWGRWVTAAGASLSLTVFSSPALVSISSAAGADSDFASELRVLTIAGDGVAGDRDGDALHARFFEPTSVAFGKANGIVYVADAGGQKIRRIVAGRVETVAGGGGLTPERGAIIGAYVDGPAAHARFNRPSGIAVSADGTVYVADTNNHRIRAIRNGTVSTMAGDGQSGSDDGPRGAARFKKPVSISVDDDGILYVADYGNGIRRIDRAGHVTTLPLTTNRAVLGVSVRGANSHLTLAYTDTSALYLISNGTTEHIDRGQVSAEGPYPTGAPSGIAVLDEGSLLFTDIGMSAIRYFRARQLGQTAMVRSVIGRTDDTTAQVEGFRDGGPMQASFSAPASLTWNTTTGQAYIADTGNRRIRLLTGFSSTRPVTTDISKLEHRAGSYRIALLGNSYLNYGVLWNESIAGRIESRLNRDKSRVGLRKQVRVIAIRSDGIKGTAEAQYAAEILSSGVVDAVIVIINFRNIAADYPQFSFDGPWRTVYSAAFGKARSSFKAAKVPLMILSFPDSLAVTPLERYSYRTDQYSFGSISLTEERALAAAIDTWGVPHLNLLDRIATYEAGNRAAALYSSYDHHLSVAGNELIGDAAARYLEDWKPWAH